MAGKKSKAPPPTNNTAKTWSLGVRVPHEVIARMDAVAPRLVAAGAAVVAPSRSDLINAALLSYLPTLEAKCANVAAPVAPSATAKTAKAK